jgi:hypothetical protein
MKAKGKLSLWSIHLVQLHENLWALNESEWLILRPCGFNPRKAARILILKEDG